jgi:hypothetical protein
MFGHFVLIITGLRKSKKNYTKNMVRKKGHATKMLHAYCLGTLIRGMQSAAFVHHLLQESAERKFVANTRPHDKLAIQHTVHARQSRQIYIWPNRAMDSRQIKTHVRVRQ